MALGTGIQIPNNFDINSPLPLDARTVAADIDARDAIPEVARYRGLTVEVLDDGGTQKAYKLVGGVGNENWVDISDISGVATLLGYKSGFILANDGTTPDTILSVSSGKVNDDTGTLNIVLSSAMRKSIASTWTAGTGNGALDTGSVASNTWYSVFAISGVSGVSDILFSTSRISPVMPSGYTYKRYIGAIFYSSNIRRFIQVGSKFRFTNANAVTSVDVTLTTANTQYLATMPSIPTGGSFLMELQVRALNSVSNSLINISSPLDTAQGVVTPDHANFGIGVTAQSCAGNISVFSNSSKQVALVALANGTVVNLRVAGWEDTYL